MRPVVLALSRPCRAPHATLMNPGLRKALPRAMFSRPVGAPIQRFRFQSEDVGNGQGMTALWLRVLGFVGAVGIAIFGRLPGR